ncbi:MAG TPA: hypothetical protein VEQ63_08390 [Bryobacteraceae bacterium]|nr:hypothetical protein [Bryobacteraceae bacterium]
MKPIVMFVVGALGAGVLMYMLMRPDRTAVVPKPAPAAVEQAASVPDPEPAQPLAAEEEQKPSPAVERALAPERPAPRETRRASQQPAVVARKTTAPPASSVPSAPAPPTAPPVGSSSQSPQPGEIAKLPPEPVNPVEPARAVELPKPPPRIPQTVTIPAGTLVTVRVDQTLSTESNQTGDSFRASLDQPLVVDGMVIAERGARVEGRVVEADNGGRVQGLARLSLELVRLNTSDGQRLALQTESFAKQAQSDKKRDAAKIGAAAGIGAAIGAIAGGGKGAAVGAAVGGAAGAGGVLGTRGQKAEVPAETRMTFKLRQSITVTEKLP